MTNKNTIKINDLQKELKKVFSYGYKDTIEFKYNGGLIPICDILNFTIPTIDNLKKLDNGLIDLKINGEYYEVIK